MYDFFKIGEEVSFQSLPDMRLIVEEINEVNGNVRCKYYDDNLRKYIRLTLPAEALVTGKKKQLTQKILSRKGQSVRLDSEIPAMYKSPQEKLPGSR